MMMMMMMMVMMVMTVMRMLSSSSMMMVMPSFPSMMMIMMIRIRITDKIPCDRYEMEPSHTTRYVLSTANKYTPQPFYTNSPTHTTR